MDREARASFVAGYSKVLTQSWADADYRSRFMDNPGAVLAAEGVSVPDGLQIVVVTEVQEEGTLEDQIQLWEDGLSAGSAKLFVPDTPQMQDGELSDTQLEAVAGGGDCCCSCTPCCTCT